MWCVLQQAVQGFGLCARCLGETFGGPSCRCSQRHIDLAITQQHQQGTDRGRFACARATGENTDFLAVCHLHGLPLLLGQMHVAFLLEKVEDGVP